MITIQNNQIIFPEIIDFSHISYLSDMMNKLTKVNSIVFDLSKTKSANAAFVGFMICLKNEKEKDNGTILLRVSPKMQNILNTLQLGGYFESEKISA
jgi:anti-anti-sigma regulatory factor